MNRFEAAARLVKSLAKLEKRKEHALVRVVAKFELERQKLVAEYDDDVVKLVMGDPE